VETIQEDGGLVRSVAWAPGGQRGYELIATGSKTGFVRIFKLEEAVEGINVGGGAWRSTLIMEQYQGGAENEVQRVEWNCVGTVLISSGDDGRVRLWKEDYLGKWKQYFVASAEQTPAETSEDTMYY
jgi:nucleoporin SEH1